MFRARVARLAAEVGAIEGPVLGARRIVATQSEKRLVREATGALAVDLESDVVARIATSAGIPFVVVRTIADSVYRELPPAALIPLAENGTPKLFQVLASVRAGRGRSRPCVGLARETRTALAALVTPARALHGLVAAA